MGQSNWLIMIDYSNGNIEKVSAHYIGNKTNGEELHLSKSVLDISDLRLRELLLKFFLDPFSNQEFYSFTFTNGDFTLNPVFNFVSNIFENKKHFMEIQLILQSIYMNCRSIRKLNQAIFLCHTFQI